MMGARRADRGHRARPAGRQLCRRTGSDDHFPVLYSGRNGRVAHECILDLRPLTKASGDHRRRRRQTAGRLRLPRPDHELPGRRHADGRTDRVGEPRGARPVLRRHDHHPGRDRPGRVGGVAARRQPAGQRTAHPGPGDGRRVGASLLPTASPPSRPDCTRDRSTPTASTSTGRRSAGSTAASATATWSAPARRRRPSSSGLWLAHLTEDTFARTTDQIDRNPAIS